VSRLTAGRAILLAVTLATLPALGVPAPPGPVQARAYEVRYKALKDAAELVGQVLSPEGTVTLSPRLRTLVVQDRPEVLDRVAQLLRGFDVPPHTVEVTFSLLLASDRRAEEAGRQAAPQSLSREVRGVTETLGDFTKWTSYQLLGSRSATGSEGTAVEAVLSDEYRVRFEVESYDEANGKVKFRSVSLQRVVARPDGERRVENLYTAEIVVDEGRLMTVGAAKSPDSPRALFLTLQAKAR
jgi:hypothetical protein